MRKRLVLAGSTLLLLTLAFAAGSLFHESQHADYGWNPGRGGSEFPGRPLVLFDEAHHNASTAGLAGRYWPFARLLRAEGVDFVRWSRPFTPAGLAGARVLVIVNASGAARPQVFGVNLPVPGRGRRGDPAFSRGEIATIRKWVESGGSLLLVADHAPFGEAAADLAEVFGVTMHLGFTEVPNELSDPLLFSRENGRLGDHEILRGHGALPGVGRVMTFTGQSLDGPPGSTTLLQLPPGAIEYVPAEDSLVACPAGAAQALALECGRGRVVVLGEAAMATAQVSRSERFGMNAPGNDNRRFVLNVLHWLARTP